MKDFKIGDNIIITDKGHSKYNKTAKIISMNWSGSNKTFLYEIEIEDPLSPPYMNIYYLTEDQISYLDSINCKHEWVDTGGLIWSFCKKCNENGEWNKKEMRYIKHQ